MNKITKVLMMAITLCLSVIGFQPLHMEAQQSYTFTNCGATGRFGPTQTMVTTAYANTNLSLVATTNPTSGIQTWTVPYTGLFRITAIGASGGDATSGPAPGNGAIMRGDFMLNAGEVIQILVGQMGQDRQFSAGGGGGTYVVRTPYNATTAVLVVAGGGGASSADYAGLSAVTASCGTFDVNSGPAQCAGNGGISFTGNSGGGGGGFLTDVQLEELVMVERPISMVDLEEVPIISRLEDLVVAVVKMEPVPMRPVVAVVFQEAMEVTVPMRVKAVEVEVL